MVIVIKKQMKWFLKINFQILNSNSYYLCRMSHCFQNHNGIYTYMNHRYFCSLHWYHNYQYSLCIHQYLQINNISNTNLYHLWSHTCTFCCAVSRVPNVAFARIGSNIVETSSIFKAVMSLCDAFVNIWVKYIERKNQTVKTAKK